MTTPDRQLIRTKRAAEGGPLALVDPIGTAAKQDYATVTRTVVADTSSNVTGTYKIKVFDLFAVVIIAARFNSEASIASDGTNYDTFTLTSDDDKGGSATTVSTTTGVNTSATALAANQSVAMPLNATVANLAIAKGGALYLVEAKAGAGKAMTGPYSIDVTYRIDDTT